MGEVFAGRFELLDPIAAGAMGEVWTARDHRDGSLVAVKLLRQSDAGGLLRFVREQGMRIHHPHVVTPLAWAGMDDRVLFSMPLVDGGSVATLVGDYGALPSRYAAELLRQLLEALRAVHAAGIVHRDVKPANLLLDATGTGRPRLRLTDFGVAVPLDAPRLTTTAHVIGTRGYMAPEQEQWADPDPSQDLYSAGMVGRELLTGVRARSGPPMPPADVDPVLWGLLDRLTSVEPTARPRVEEALTTLSAPSLAWQEQDQIDVLRQVELPAPAPAPTAVTRTDEPTRRTPMTAPHRSAAPMSGATPVAATRRHRDAGPIALIVAGVLVMVATLAVAVLL